MSSDDEPSVTDKKQEVSSSSSQADYEQDIKIGIVSTKITNKSMDEFRILRAGTLSTTDSVSLTPSDETPSIIKDMWDKVTALIFNSKTDKPLQASIVSPMDGHNLMDLNYKTKAPSLSIRDSENEQTDSEKEIKISRRIKL